MDDISAVHRLQGTQRLVGEVLTVVVRQLLGSNHTVKVGLHEFLDEVDFSECLVGARLDDVEDADDVFGDIAFLEEAKELELTQGAKGKHLMFEGLNFLDSYLLTCSTMNSAAYDAVGSFADDLADFVLAADAKADGRFRFFVA